MRKSHGRQKSKSSLKSGREVTDCLSRNIPTSVQNTKCQISWQDVDKFNLETQDRRNPGKIKIDSEKLISSIKHAESRTKELQLIALSKHVISTNPDSIMGTNRYLMLQIIQNNGYQNYINNHLIQEVANSPNTKISPQLKEVVLNSGNKAALIFSGYLSTATCYYSDYRDCFHSAIATGYLLPAGYVQKALINRLPKFIDNLATASGKVLPKFLGHNTKFAIKTIGVKHGSKIVKGALGAVEPAFDFLSITFAVHDLMECNDREETDNPCSSKERRDSIATIGISGVSFVAGSILVATGTAATGWGVGLGLGIVAFTLIYTSVSNVIEYDEKYGTTFGENLKIIFLKPLFLDDPEDIKHLTRKTDDINKIAMYTAEHLKNTSFSIVAYAVGLGRVVLFKKECHFGVINTRGWYKVPGNYCNTVPDLELHSGHSDIDLSSSIQKYANKLSRVLPKPIEGMRFICLPALTDSIYEKEDTSNLLSSYPDVKHYCNNSMVIEHNARMQNSSIAGKSVFFNLQYVNSGKFTGSNTFTQILSSASRLRSRFASISQKISNLVKYITKVGQQFGDSSSDRLDLDTIINTKSIDQVLLNDFVLIRDGNTDNNSITILASGHFDINNILHLGIVFCTKNPLLQNSYISLQKALEIQQEMVFQEILQNFEQAMNRWINVEEDCAIQSGSHVWVLLWLI